MQSPAQAPDSAANQWLIDNPYVLPVRQGKVRKTELFNVLGITADRFRKEVRIICDSDSDFEQCYIDYREKRYVSIVLAEIIVKRMIDNPYCTVQFEKVTKVRK